MLAPDGLRSRYEAPSDTERRVAQLYRRAAKAGHLEAMTNLGLFTLPRTDLLERKFEAADWLHRAEQRGEVRAKAFGRGTEETKERVLDDLLSGDLNIGALSAEEDAWIRSVWRRPYF